MDFDPDPEVTATVRLPDSLQGKKRSYPDSHSVNRRDFFKHTGTGLLASGFAGGASTGSTFTPSQGLTRISTNLYLLHDTCNVYILKDGNKALLIDFGSGHVLKLLGQIGITRVDGILHTHHHRDQCQGDHRAVADRIPIHVPVQERHYFEDAENFWRNRRVFHNYNVMNDFFSLTRNVPVSGTLRDYEKFRWGPYEFLIFPTPGHTLGSISLVGAVDGKKTAFTGDLIHSPGKTLTLHDLQYQYHLWDGVDFAVFSLAKLRELGPEFVCPSHGEPFGEPDAGIGELVGKLKGWYTNFFPNTPLTIENRPFAVTPHLVCSHQTTSTFYALISDSGKALFLDYGGASKTFNSTFTNYAPILGRMRFVEHTISDLKANYGLKSIDVAMPSHMHDDHLNGFPHLARHYGTKVWCYENMVDVLQNPRGYNVGCILGEPIKVDRSFRHGETFKWEEFEFTVCHSPGHTEYQMALFAEIDGARIAFTGDNFLVMPEDPAFVPRHNLIFRNWVENDSHLKSLRTILDHEPSIMAPGHGKPFMSNKGDLEDLKRRLEGQQASFYSLIADPDCDFGLNPSWARLYPYQMLAKVGSTSTLELRVRNYRKAPMQLEAALVLPSGWTAFPETLRLSIPPKGDGRETFSVAIPANWPTSNSRVPIAADIMADGRYLGQIAEAVVELQFVA